MNRTVRITAVGLMLAGMGAGVGRPQGGEGRGFQPPRNGDRLPAFVIRPGTISINAESRFEAAHQYEKNLAAVSLVWFPPTCPRENQPDDYYLAMVTECELPLRNVTVQVRIPDGVKVTGTEPAARQTAGVLTWELDRLVPHLQKNLRMTLTVPDKGSANLQAWATVASPVAECRTIWPDYDVRLDVYDVFDPVPAGGQTAYVVRVTNAGPHATQNLELTCQLPPGMCLAEAHGPTTYLERVGVDFNVPGPVKNRSTVTFEPIRNLERDASAVFHLRVHTGLAGKGTFKATLTGGRLRDPLTKEEVTTVTEK